MYKNIYEITVSVIFDFVVYRLKIIAERHNIFTYNKMFTKINEKYYMIQFIKRYKLIY